MKDIIFPTEGGGVKYGSLEINPGFSFSIRSVTYIVVGVDLVDTGDIMIHYKKLTFTSTLYDKMRVSEFSELI